MSESTVAEAPYDGSDKFTIAPDGVVVTQCLLCEHLPDGTRQFVCRAFPGRIPPAIVMNDFDHRALWPDQEDDSVLFTPRPGLTPADLASLHKHFADAKAGKLHPWDD